MHSGFVPGLDVHRKSRTHAQPRPRVRAALALVLLLSTACDPLTAGVASLGAVETGNSLCDGLEQVIARLDQAIHDQRAGLKTDVLEVVAGVREQLEGTLQSLRAVASALEDKVAADLAGQVSIVIQSTDKLVRDVNAAANESIRGAAEQLRSTIDKVQNGPLREAKAAARIVLANGSRTADGIVISVIDGATVIVIRVGAGLMLLAGVIGLVVAAIKRSRLGVWVTLGIAVAGGSVLIFAPYVARIGARKVAVPDPEKSCDAALAAGAKLEQALHAPAAARAASSGFDAGQASFLRAVRGGNELDLVKMFPGNGAVSAERPPRPALRAPAARLDLPRVAAGRGGAAVTAGPWFGRGADVATRSRTGRTGRTPIDSGSRDALHEAATIVSSQGPICIAYSMSPQKADACERYVNEALAYLGVAIVCTSSAQCPAEQWCDEHTASCMPLGVYCQRADHCGQGKECDSSLHRCVPESSFTCSSAAPCRPGQLCSDGRCADASQVVGQPCVDRSKLGPCQSGKLQADGHGGLVCSSVVQRTTEACDGIDNDCNGAVDEGLDGDSCLASALGTCRQGRRACRGGQWACDAGQARAEACNDVDDDCNGAIDDDPSCQPQTMVGGSITCGNNAHAEDEIGERCPAGYVREGCFANPGQLQAPGKGGHAEAVGWVSNDPSSCRCKVHCGTDMHWWGPFPDPGWKYTWKFTVTARKHVQ